MTLLLKVVKHLNLKCVASSTPLTSIIVDSLWGFIQVSTKEANLSLVKTELSLYQQIAMNENDFKSLYNGGKIMKNSFLLLHFLLGNFWVFYKLKLKLLQDF
jgi:hypothetical protein